MNQQMYKQIAVQENLSVLVNRGVQLIGPNSGFQACGDVGAGRMSEPEEIYQAVLAHFSNNQDLEGLNVTITAGPTREAIDPVRYISNHSSGKMGYAIANAFAERGAKVTLISGPVNLPTPKMWNELMWNLRLRWSNKRSNLPKNLRFLLAVQRLPITEWRQSLTKKLRKPMPMMNSR